MSGGAWLIPAFPLIGSVVLAVLGRRIGEPRAGWIAVGAMVGSFTSSVVVLAGLLGRGHAERRITLTLFEWMPVGDFSVDVGLLVDPLSITMALFITGVGAVIHIYAVAYMRGDADFSKFFCYLNLFVFSMLVLVLGDNLALTFLGWEGVGVCSYLLISFWFSDEANACAGKKALITNRVADWGFLLAMLLAFASSGSIGYLDLFNSADSLPTVTATAITLLLFMGAVGKSAQIPLYVWLPDAMAGPTPVSALIHAATMVTAGVYLMVRVNPIIAAADGVGPTVITWTGAATALFAATVAVAQNDIKKVLAYSTVSQLGYMMLAVGVGAYTAAVFHMVTHAFFKALLFLGAGSVIHALHGEQDMRRFGGLRKSMPVTSATFMLGWLAIAGMPPLSGFWSKDEILAAAWRNSPALWVLGLFTAVLTAFYMSRLVFMTFYGPMKVVGHPHSEVPAVGPGQGVAGSVGDSQYEEVQADRTLGDTAHTSARPHEATRLMRVPMVLLAGASVVAGCINLPFTSDLHFLGDWLEPVLFDNEVHIDLGAAAKWLLALTAAAGGLTGIVAAAIVYLQGRLSPRTVELSYAARAWYVDEALTRFVGGPGRNAFEFVAACDTVIVDGAANGFGRAVLVVGGWLRRFHTGMVRFYALFMAVGAVALLVWFLSRATL